MRTSLKLASQKSQLDPEAEPFHRFGWLNILVAKLAQADSAIFLAAHGLTQRLYTNDILFCECYTAVKPLTKDNS